MEPVPKIEIETLALPIFKFTVPYQKGAHILKFQNCLAFFADPGIDNLL